MSSRIKNDVKKLFEFWCEVKANPGVDRTSRNGTGPASSSAAGVIVESFPESFRDKEVISGIPAFAFPCKLERDSVQSYSFVNTTADSKWRFGFCRYDPKTETAMVIITYLPWHDTFLKLLPVLADLRRTDTAGFRAFLLEAYNHGVPDLGGSLTVFYNSGQSHFIFERPLQFQLPSIPENHNLNLYYNFVAPREMIAVFAAMLAERRIIFTSHHLDRLSSCIQAANAFLYPMVWQHIFIPVLPFELKDYLGAPMPYLIGVPKPVLETVSNEELGEVVILNCDTKIFESPFDDVHNLPSEIVSQLKKYLSSTQDHIGDRVSKIFLGALVQLIGGYRDAVEFHDKGKIFNHQKFIESRPTHLRPFLTKMMDLQIFAQFIDDRLKMLNNGLGFSDEFELETVRYAEKLKKRGRNYAFLKNVKDKTNPAVKSAVKSVKESSRGVKTAYKDLKSKFRDNGSTYSGTHFHFGLGSPQHSDRPDGSFARAGAAHHSAPNSPMSTKRYAGTSSPFDSFNGSSNSKDARAQTQTLRNDPLPLTMSSSSSHIQRNIGPHFNQHANKTSAVGSTSSLCSSEMNLSQELQNHPLFKKPNVDRSLKPNLMENASQQSMLVSNRARRLPSQSDGQTQHIMPMPTVLSYCNQPFAHNSTQMKIDSKPPLVQRTSSNNMPEKAPIIYHGPGHSTMLEKQRILKMTDSSFDNPPDMQSPPIPARRQHTSNVAGGSRLDRNGWHQYDSTKKHNDSIRSSGSSTASASNSSSCSSAASYTTAMSRISDPLCFDAVPIATPRVKKESPHPKLPNLSSSNESDLILLEDSNNVSFDLEDFDPLNQNARPIPELTKPFSTKSTTLPAGMKCDVIGAGKDTACINNPLYPYFAPKHKAAVAVLASRPPPLPTTLPPSIHLVHGVGKDNDFELLRKYGLDQFGSTTSTPTPHIAASVVGIKKANWTTFD